MAAPTSLRDVDWLIVAAVLLITLTGIVFVWSTSHSTSGYSSFAVKQVAWAGLGIVISAVLLRFSYLRLGKYAYLVYVLGIICLIIALLCAPRRNTRRWIHLGSFTVQPSEFMKLAMVIALAQYLRYRDGGSISTLAGVVPLVALPALLVLKQPDLGTALTMIPIAGAVLMAAGMRLKHAVVIALVGLLLLPVGWMFLKEYQQNRLWAFVNPQERKLSDGYQVIQSVVATGSGRTFGKGLGRGRVRVPETRTDFIFAAVGEEWGFVGCSGLLLLFLFLFTGSLGIAMKTREPFGRLLVVGCTTTIAIQTFINSGMTIQLAPITGLTLPMVSYGGSSLITSYVAVALILNVGMRRVNVFGRS